MPNTTGERFERAVSIMAQLREPGGCPWDREQTFDTIKPYTVEETYEVLEAIDNRDWKALPAELGDLLLQVLFYAQMAKEQGTFSIDDVLEQLSHKLIHRHPHVFGKVKAETSSDVLRNWEALKAEEKREERRKEKREETSEEGSVEKGEGKNESLNTESVLAGVSSAMPALLEARKLSSRASHVGFDWPHIGGLFEKLREETDELRSELENIPAAAATCEFAAPRSSKKPVPERLQARIEEEIGDMFFVLVNLARFLTVDPESALKKANRKFRRRFQWMEDQLRLSGRGPADAHMEELETLWQRAKDKDQAPKPASE